MFESVIKRHAKACRYLFHMGKAFHIGWWKREIYEKRAKCRVYGKMFHVKQRAECETKVFHIEIL